VADRLRSSTILGASRDALRLTFCLGARGTFFEP
jgi:hypothetical protein